MDKKYDEEPRNTHISSKQIQLEILFDTIYKFKDKVEGSSTSEYEEVDIGSPKNPRMVKIRKRLTWEENKVVETLVRELWDAFSWSYDELKTYRLSIL